MKKKQIAEKQPWPKCSTKGCNKDSVLMHRDQKTGTPVHECADHSELGQRSRKTPPPVPPAKKKPLKKVKK